MWVKFRILMTIEGIIKQGNRKALFQGNFMSLIILYFVLYKEYMSIKYMKQNLTVSKIRIIFKNETLGKWFRGFFSLKSNKMF